MEPPTLVYQEYQEVDYNITCRKHSNLINQGKIITMEGFRAMGKHNRYCQDKFKKQCSLWIVSFLVCFKIKNNSILKLRSKCL